MDWFISNPYIKLFHIMDKNFKYEINQVLAKKQLIESKIKHITGQEHKTDDQKKLLSKLLSDKMLLDRELSKLHKLEYEESYQRINIDY